MIPYMAYLHKAEDGSYGVTLPDFPGCFTHINTLSDLPAMANEAISLHLNEGEELPRPGTDHVYNSEYTGGIWVMFFVTKRG